MEVEARARELMRLAAEREARADAERRVQQINEWAADEAKRLVRSINMPARIRAAQHLIDAHPHEFIELLAQTTLEVKVEQYRRVFSGEEVQIPLHVGWIPSITKGA